jgi:hypothetical protein
MTQGHAADVPMPAVTHLPADHRWHRLPALGAGIGAAGIVLSLVLSIGDTSHRFYFSYLVAFMFFLSVSLGALLFVLIQYTAKAGWSVVVRRIAENLMALLPLFAVLFIPVAFGVHHLYHWTHTEAVLADPVLAGKSGYLNLPFFFVRAAIYLAAWTAISVWFLRRSVEQDGSGDLAITRRLQAASPPCIGVYALTSSFAAIDWMMSMDPHWFSTIFGVYYFAGSFLAVNATMAIIAVTMRRNGLLGEAITAEHFHALGRFLFAFTVFWTYIAFSQYMLIWYANLPEETMWFAKRTAGSWQTVGMALMVGHFGLPFFFLLPRGMKRREGTLVAAAAWLLLMHYVDLYWLILPVHDVDGVHPRLIDVTTFLGIGGLVAGAYGWLMRRHALLPVKDPRLAESLAFDRA